ncbi:MAG: hypothetical protein LBI06_05765 [Treponema sp.]|nr:hypothetical protein [Treponema sp.]
MKKPITPKDFILMDSAFLTETMIVEAKREFNRPKPGGRKPLIRVPIYGIPPVQR